MYIFFKIAIQHTRSPLYTHTATPLLFTRHLQHTEHGNIYTIL
jgi:hypothetical protein